MLFAMCLPIEAEERTIILDDTLTLIRAIIYKLRNDTEFNSRNSTFYLQCSVCATVKKEN